MNKPAPKEPSMDEILSSIRQIIADDDAAGTPRRPSIQAAPPPMDAAPRPMLSVASQTAAPTDFSDILDDIEPLSLSSAQIVSDDADEPEDDPIGGLSFEAILADTAAAPEPELVDPEDIAFDLSDLEAEAEPLEAEVELPVAVVTPFKPIWAPEPVRTAMEAPRATAPAMPDPTLSTDMAERLLEPATNAAVRGTFARLGQMGLGAPGVTIEGMIRDMLRPMLKEWLDENLPSVVERMVEKEIARISRGE